MIGITPYMPLDPFIRLHVRQAAMVYVAVRIAATIPLWFAAEAPQELAGLLVGTGLVGLTVFLVAVDQRLNGAPDLFANLGISRMQLAVLSGAPAAICELAWTIGLSWAPASATTALRHV